MNAVAGERPASPTVTATPLDGGGLKLSRAGRASGQDGVQKEPARIITMAWGERYLSDLLAMTIPAMLAPGNIPAFAQHFDCELVIVTERRFFASFARSPVIFNALKFCDVRLLPIDDLLSRWYGITLTYALVRGFADLGPKMVDTHLVFINADFILADGSYRKLAEKILQGERLVVSPSYCMVLEDTIETLRAHYNPADCSLTVSRREMAALALAHRHNTVRAKTVNQQLFRIHRYDQFYWHVDEHTLLGHQMPIAVVYMRPERALTEMPTFWDYGVISEYCPTVKPCVLGDSDDFLFGELRTDGTFRELLHLGWPSVDEIAKDLSSFTTHDQRVYGRFPLVLHSADLPANLEAEREKLKSFVDEVYRRLTPPVSYRNHVFWASAFPQFVAMQAEQVIKLRANIQNEAHGPDSLIEGPAIQESAGSTEIRDAEAKLARLDADYLSARRPIEQELEHWRSIRRTSLTQSQENDAASGDRLSNFLAQTGSQPRPEGAPAPATPFAASQLPGRKLTPLDALGHIYRRIFGRLNNMTKWHPLYLVLKPAVSAIKAHRRPLNTLVISSGGPWSTAFTESIAGKKVTRTPKMILNTLYGGLANEKESFDLCVCDLSFSDLRDFHSILPKLRAILAPRAKIVIFHCNTTLRDLDQETFEFSQRLFPLAGESKISFAGSLMGAAAMRWFQRSIERCDMATTSGRLALGFMLSICGPLARLALYAESKRPALTYPKYCTSMTIEIALKP